MGEQQQRPAAMRSEGHAQRSCCAAECGGGCGNNGIVLSQLRLSQCAPAAVAVPLRWASAGPPARPQSVDSAGTSNEHQGDQPDSRSIAVAKRNGINISTHRAQQLTPEHWNTFDVILASVSRGDSEQWQEQWSLALLATAGGSLCARCLSRSFALRMDSANFRNALRVKPANGERGVHSGTLRLATIGIVRVTHVFARAAARTLAAHPLIRSGTAKLLMYLPKEAGDVPESVHAAGRSSTQLGLSAVCASLPQSCESHTRAPNRLR